MKIHREKKKKSQNQNLFCILLSGPGLGNTFNEISCFDVSLAQSVDIVR